MPKQNSKSKQLTLPDLIVLSLLSEKPMHGYQLVSELEIREVQDWAAISRPQVYYSLDKLMRLRFIVKAQDLENSLGPEKTTFKINKNGEEALTASLSTFQWAQQRTRPLFLMWMALSSHLPKNAIRNLFAERRKYLQNELERERATLASLKDAKGPMVIAGKLMVELTARTFEVELRWLDDAQAQMASRS